MNMIANSNCERPCPRAQRRPLGTVSLLIALGCFSLAASPDASISPSVAALFVGEEKIVEGTVTAAERDNNVVRLHLDNPPQGLVVSLVIGLLNTFPPSPEVFYLGKTVRVGGTIRSFRGAPEIVIHDGTEIQVADNATTHPAAAEADHSKQGTRQEGLMQHRIETLTEQVRQLEQRVHELEGSRATP